MTFVDLNKKRGAEPGAWINLHGKVYLAKAIPLYNVIKEKNAMDFYSIFSKTPFIRVGLATESVMQALFHHFAEASIAMDFCNHFLITNSIQLDGKTYYPLFLSEKVENFYELGKDYANDIEQFHALRTICLSNLSLRGIPTLLSIAKVLGDTDCIGGSGSNMGFIVEKDKKGECYGRAIPVDVGFALENVNCQLLPKQTPKDIRVASTRPLFIQYENMLLTEKQEYISTLKSISQLTESQIQAIFYLPDLVNKVICNIHSLSEVYCHDYRRKF